MIELNPEIFTYDCYESNYWSYLGLDCFHDESDFIRQLKKYAIGYCDASRLSIRPRTNMYAVMCEVDGYTFWFHIEKNKFDSIKEN